MRFSYSGFRVIKEEKTVHIEIQEVYGSFFVKPYVWVSVSFDVFKRCLKRHQMLKRKFVIDINCLLLDFFLVLTVNTKNAEICISLFFMMFMAKQLPLKLNTVSSCLVWRARLSADRLPILMAILYGFKWLINLC